MSIVSACAVVARLDAAHLVAPADVDRVELGGALAQELLEVILLQVDEGGHLVPVLRQEVEAIEERVALEDLADLPGDALLQAFVGDAEPVEDLQRALGVADAARALADAVGVVEKHHRHAALREIDRGAEADRAGADDDDRVVRVAPVLVGRAAIRELAESAALVHAIRLVIWRAERGAERHAAKASTSLRLAIAAI